MDKTYVLSCPICGASLTYEKDELSTVCASCKNTVYRERRPQDINLNLKYAVISDGSAFTTITEARKPDFSIYPEDKEFKPVEQKNLDAITVSKIDGLVYELTINYTGDITLDENDKERRAQIVDEILKLDGNNIYGRFLRDIIIPDKLKLNKMEEIFSRKDSLLIQDYMLSFFPIDVGQDVDVIVLIIPMINYIMHTDLSSDDKYYHIIRAFKKNYPFQSIRPSIFENEGPERINRIIDGYRTLLSALIHLNVSHKMTEDTTKILKDHFNGLSNPEIIKLFINYILQSNLTSEEKQKCIEDFIANDVSELTSFNECYSFLGFINSIGYERSAASRLTQLAINTCMPKSITFDGYAILNRFIKDSRIRFFETYRLYLRFSETLFFKQMLVQVLYTQKILDKDDMLLFVDCVAVFAKVSLISEKKLNNMHLNQDVLKRLGLTTYSESVRKYNWHIIRNLRKWATLDKNELLLEILVEKKSLFGTLYKETPKERDIGDRVIVERKASMAAVKRSVRIAQIIACAASSILIFLSFYHNVGNAILAIIVGAAFYVLFYNMRKKKESAEAFGVLFVGLLVISFFIGINTTPQNGFAVALFTLLQIPLYYILGFIIFEPLFGMLTAKSKLVCDTLLSEEREERVKTPCEEEKEKSKK